MEKYIFQFHFLLGIFLLTLGAMAQEVIPLKGDELFGTLRARQIGPALMSGRVADLEGHPTNPRIMYVGSAGGGVWRSQDGGVTYKPIFDKHAQSIGVITLDPTNPDKTIWVGTGEIWTRNSVSIGDGIYKSTDGGESFTKMGLEKSERIAAIQIDPTNPNTVYVGVQGALWSASPDRGIYKTTDGGKNWEKIWYVDENTGCSELVIDPKNPNVLYAAFWEHRRTAWSFNSGGLQSALYKSTDAGKTWNKIHNGFPAGKLGRIAVAVAPSNPNILYSVIESEKDETKGLYRSDDAGANWKRTNGDFELTVRPFYFSRIVIDPKNPDILYKAGLSGSVSRDGGKTFRTLGNMHSDIHDIWINPANTDHLTVATDGGVYRSWDGGSVLEMVKNLPLSQFYQVSVDNAKPYRIYGGLQDNGSWYGPSESPGGIENRDWFSVGQGDGFRVYRHPTKPNIVYSEMQGAEYIWRYDTDRRQSKIIKPLAEANEPKLRFNWNAAMNISPHQPDRLYIGSQFLHRSDDMGETWTKISPDLTTNDPTKQQQENSGGLSADNSGAENHCTIFSVAESPLDQNIIWVGTDDGNVQLTTDGGKTWTNVVANVPNLPKNTWAYHVEPSRFDKNTCYVVFDGHTSGDFTPYTYKTTDGGKTWKSIITKDIPTYVRHIKEDLVNPNLLFLGTEMGLYVSVDGGQNWSNFKSNVPPVAIHYIAIQPETNDLVLATHGRGIIILDDISPLRQITKELVAKEVAFMQTKPTVIREDAPFAEGGDAGEYIGENPSRVAKIIYYLKSRHTFGKMTMEVFDKDGKKVGDLNPGKAKGINVVDWAYRLPPPKVAKAKTLSFGGFVAPRLPVGNYTVKLTKGNNTYEHKVVLMADPNSMHTDADRAAQFATTMKLYDMTEQLAYMVDNLDAMRQGAADRLAKNAKLKKLVEPMLKEFDALKETLVVTKGDNYVGAAEPQFREKLASLYGEVAGYAGRPSNAQMANLKVLETRFDEAKTKIEGFKTNQLAKLNAQLLKLKLEEIKLRSFEEFKAIEK
ncbi:MAG: VPS10 domain-containing protein [Runella sp.]